MATDAMTRHEIEALLEKAERVTPGPVYIVGLLQADDEQFVAACAPEVIAALCRRALEAEKVRAALAALVGVNTRTELEQMEMELRSLPAPAQDKANAINAIHVLLATLPAAARDRAPEGR